MQTWRSKGLCSGCSDQGGPPLIVSATALAQAGCLPGVYALSPDRCGPTNLPACSCSPRCLQTWCRGGSLCSKRLWLIGGTVVMRSTTLYMASRYTLAVYIQLIDLMTSFLVALIGTLLFGERLHRRTGLTMIVSAAMVAMVMVEDLAGSGFMG